MMKKEKKPGILQSLKLTQKIFLIFILLLFLVINSWAFTFTTVLDFQDNFKKVESYAFPSVIITSELKDHVHIALLGIYNYVTTGETASKENFESEFTEAVRSEYELFQLSETSTDFLFTQQFNEKLLAISTAADTLVISYESGETPEIVARDIQQLNKLRDDFNAFLEEEITKQITQQIENSNEQINTTVSQIRYYLIVIALFIVLIIIFLVYFISNNITKPVAHLTKAAQDFGSGHFYTVKLKRNDELGLFAKTFNRMASDIQASQVALQEELEKTKELDHQKSEFLSVAAHQLRTPMSGIRWAAQMLFDGDMGKINDEQKHHLEMSLENIDRMIRLINDLLDVTKIEEQKFTYEFVKTDFRSVIEEVLNRLTNQAKEKKVHIFLDYQPDNANLMLELDKEKMQLALNNLVDNAIKYSQLKGEVEVRVTKKSNSITCTIRDHGIGIPKNFQDQIFVKFFRGANAMKMFADGSGLGLFICKDIITKHGGTINFESIEKEGTTFTIQLPLTQPVTAAQRFKEDAIAVSAPTEPPT